MRPVQGAAARARVAERLTSSGVDLADARAMLARERRCGDHRLVKLLTRFRDAEARADAVYNTAASVRAEKRADDAWDALARYVGVIL